MDVLLHGRDEERLAAVAEEVRQLGRRVALVAGDVTEPGLNERLLDVAETELGGFYAVFANAGYGFKKPAHELSMDELRRLFEVNFFACYELVATAARRLIATQRPGHLLMCSSGLAKFTLLNFSAYSATKAAQNHVCRAMRWELRRHDIEVASVHPITTRTDFFLRTGEERDASIDPAQAYRHVPRWLLQKPETVANAIVRCLRRPVPEVWTSLLARTAAGLITIFPRLADVMGRRIR